MTSIKLSILDQSPISEGQTATEALTETVELAKWADRAGFNRFWVSEHHDTASLAGSSPEVLISHIGSHTKNLRLGSGGIMLPHYSAYKVAENFKLLEALFPNRIDLGIGRAPGGMPRASYALADGRPRDVKRYPQQVDELLMYLNDTIPDDHPYKGLIAGPISDSIPPVWMLGSSPSSALVAAEKGLPYSFALFINGEGGESFMHKYRQHFQPSPYLKKPKTMVTVFVVCAETEERANYIAGSKDLAMLMAEQGMTSKGTPHPDKFLQYKMSPYEEKRVEFNRNRMVVGTPEKVKVELNRISREYETDELMLATITYDFKDKLKSFELIAREFGYNEGKH